MEKAYISVPEFIRTFGLGRTYTYELIAANKLSSAKVGKRRLVEVEAAKRYFASQQHAGSKVSA